ncbi:hypothetical protein QYE76_017369 [Lolium multiflorum]|uniref:Uncharacterized protein n=1 Tax=Lolium multiflorum TaxID=4521 RepID=A0AAD8UWY4_LOLMU|nr:hypothetical protein QYE76_017369 [Lolium multiflorum]
MQRDPLIVGSIVGDIVDYFDASARLRVLYGNREMTIGSELRPSHVANQPTVQITGLSGSFYTLPKRPFAKMEYVHWLVTDIPEGEDVSRGTEVVGYKSHNQMTRIHRFAFAVFARQCSR